MKTDPWTKLFSRVRVDGGWKEWQLISEGAIFVRGGALYDTIPDEYTNIYTYIIYIYVYIFCILLYIRIPYPIYWQIREQSVANEPMANVTFSWFVCMTSYDSFLKIVLHDFFSLVCEQHLTSLGGWAPAVLVQEECKGEKDHASMMHRSGCCNCSTIKHLPTNNQLDQL